MKHLSVVAIVALSVLVSWSRFIATGFAQTDPSSKAPQSSGDYVFRSTVRRVPIDVVVQDKDGKPVRGLKQSDFKVQEDGKDQRVLTFDASDGTAAAFVPPKLPPMPPNTFVDMPREPERGPLYILYYDMVNTSQEDQMSFRAELLKFVDNAAPGTRIALFVNAKGLHMLQGFTTDHALLREAILRKGPPPSIPDVFLFGETFGRYDAGAALANFNFMAEYLAGLPDRKNLIWLASYFPIPVGPTVVGTDTTKPSSPPMPGSVGGMGGPATLDLSELLRDRIRNTYASLMRSRVALYPVSLSGVTGSNDAVVVGGGDAIVDRQNLDSIAASTGGRAFYGNNRSGELIEKAVEHGESYYTLSYAPQNANFDGSERRIHVALADDGKKYRLTYRSVYYAVSDDAVQNAHKKDVVQQRFLAAKAADTLYATAEHGAPMIHDLLFIAHMSAVGEPRTATAEEMRALEDSPAFFRTRKHNQNPKPLAPVKLQQYVINYDVIDPALRAAAMRKQQPTVLEFAAAAYANDGTMLNSILNKGEISNGARPEGKVDHRFQAVQELQVPPGAAYIRVVVRNTANDRTGALEVRLPLKPQVERAAVK
ncbi:VWA domain-containing protein [Occallatibacter savannae]|uniref:VWA domain-containing protein n=1 Tax=Occallatibacter savannae TaxID=1002691 RepID=UPI000D69E2A8|nr:VWA domain-containing protein [Occallatibacter savannae]